jgi:hypothetical protein
MGTKHKFVSLDIQLDIETHDFENLPKEMQTFVNDILQNKSCCLNGFAWIPVFNDRSPHQ